MPTMVWAAVIGVPLRPIQKTIQGRETGPDGLHSTMADSFRNQRSGSLEVSNLQSILVMLFAGLILVFVPGLVWASIIVGLHTMARERRRSCAWQQGSD